VPVLVYTLVPVVTLRKGGGELTSELVSILLDHDFGLVMSADYTDILEQAPPQRMRPAASPSPAGA
jgi:hypothetical protein